MDNANNKNTLRAVAEAIMEETQHSVEVGKIYIIFSIKTFLLFTKISRN